MGATVHPIGTYAEAERRALMRGFRAMLRGTVCRQIFIHPAIVGTTLEKGLSDV